MGIKMIAYVREFSSVAGRPDGVLGRSQKQCDLSDIEGSCAVLEHLWNTNVVHRWGPLVNPRRFWC
jgi:hypothetical protein